MRRFLRRHPEYLMAAYVMILVVCLALARSADVGLTVGADSRPTAGDATSDERR